MNTNSVRADSLRKGDRINFGGILVTVYATFDSFEFPGMTGVQVAGSPAFYLPHDTVVRIEAP
jgi:hypothetical protein